MTRTDRLGYGVLSRVHAGKQRDTYEQGNKISNVALQHRSLDHLVGAGEQHRRSRG
jgi:hypothetical protein